MGLRHLLRASCASLILGIAEASSIQAQARPVIAPRLVVQSGHSNTIIGLGFSPNDSVLASLDDDGALKLWESASGREIRTINTKPEGAALYFAFSPDGKQLATASRTTVTVRDVATGAVVHTLHADSVWMYVRDIAYTTDGKLAVAGDTGRLGTPGSAVDVREPETGAIIWRGTTRMRIHAIATQPGGKAIAAAGPGGAVDIWEVGSAAISTPIRRLDAGKLAVEDVLFSPGGKVLAAAADDGSLRTWMADNWNAAQVFPKGYDRADAPQSNPYFPLAFSGNGRVLMTARRDSANQDVMSLWNVDNGTLINDVRVSERWISDIAGAANFIAFAEDRHITTLVLASNRVVDAKETSPWVEGVHAGDDSSTVVIEQGDIAVWDLKTGSVRLRTPSGGNKEAVAVDAPRNRLFVSDGWSVTLLDLRDGHAVWKQKVIDATMILYGTSGMAISPDGRYVFVTGDDESVRVLRSESGEVLASIPVTKRGLYAMWLGVSADGKHLGVIARDKTGWETQPSAVYAIAPNATGVALKLEYTFGDAMYSTGPAKSLGAFSRDGRLFIGNEGRFGGPVIRSLETGQVVTRLSDGKVPFAFTPDSRAVVAPFGLYDSVGVWDATTGARVRAFGGHTNLVTSVAVTADGKHLVTGSWDHTSRMWDLANGNELAALVAFNDSTWTVTRHDGRFDTNSIERLNGINWVMPDEPFHPLPLEIFMRDYYEPRLLTRTLAGERMPGLRDLSTIDRRQPAVRIQSERYIRGDTTASLTVNVASTGSSGAEDLFVFRDGRIVAQRKGDLLQGADSARIVVDDVKLPRAGGARDSVVFSAYAFNHDRVKSPTARSVTQVRGLAARRGRAYVISLGIDTYTSPAWNLSFAANDARLVQSVVAERLRAAGQFDTVLAVPLIASADSSGRATKEQFRGVIDLLAGRTVPAAVRATIPGADAIRQATPEDLVIFSFSTHGYTDSTGVFYLLPENIGPASSARGITQTILSHAISTDELSDWFLKVDAGEIVMVVDACHSAAAVQGAGFKPGPMGSRGLGQLAYNKGMRVLAASQASDVALESSALKQGLLTYALVHEGLDASKADAAPADGAVSLEEWLNYGVRRVPELYKALKEGTLEGSRGIEAGPGAVRLQQPSLFDFAQKRSNVIVSRR
jgi:WD40 repeat protein